MDGDLYEQMLQSQSWLGMLDSDTDRNTSDEPEAEDGERQGPRGDRCGRGRRPGWGCGAGAGAGGFGSGAFAGRVPGFGPFQMFVGTPPFGPPPHGGPPHGGPPHGGPPHGPPHGGPHGGPGHHGPPHGGPGHHGRHGHGGGRHGCGPQGFGPRPHFGHRELPLVDIKKEASGGYVLLANVPGFSKKDVEVKVSEFKLTIKGKLPEHEEAEEMEMVTCERRTFTCFDRTIRLWPEVDTKKITAKLEHGVLTIKLPITAAAEPKDIPVDSGSDDEFVAVADHDDGAAAPSSM